ncbi:hypothetical protein PCASD_11707 [Puccinia coronata f. sp. avenae]|uniref:Uncharacterized protein n=1 Tax=Puccinia coronata f. sp. avenae TaxID=200324 RepID=A0A2N5UME2_9BASI|nr:hypothetical protein PCASD_11707 [Puccinia coronata f. sp. avenae]
MFWLGRAYPGLPRRYNGARHPDLASRVKNRGPADPTPASPNRFRVVPTRHNSLPLASLFRPDKCISGHTTLFAAPHHTTTFCHSSTKIPLKNSWN